MKIERGEITSGTVNNWFKAVRLFLEMNDVVLNWKKIKRMLPTIRWYAHDMVATFEVLGFGIVRDKGRSSTIPKCFKL